MWEKVANQDKPVNSQDTPIELFNQFKKKETNLIQNLFNWGHIEFNRSASEALS